MLLARKTHVVQKDGIHHDRDIYFADELSGMVGEEVEVAHMPHDRRWIEVFHDGRWLATARPSVELDAAARVRALERRREDEKALKAWARRARRRASCGSRRSPRRARSSSSTRPPPARTAGASTGRATLRLLGLEGQLNRPLEEKSRRPTRAASDRDDRRATISVWSARGSCKRRSCCSVAARSGTCSQRGRWG